MIFNNGSDLCVCVWSVTQWYLTLCDPMDCSLPGSSSMEFSRQEYRSGLAITIPEDLPDPGIEPTSPTLVDRFLTTEPPGKHLWKWSIPVLFCTVAISHKWLLRASKRAGKVEIYNFFKFKKKKRLVKKIVTVGWHQQGGYFCLTFH